MDKQIIRTLRGDDSSLPDSFGDSLHFGICALSVLSCICWPVEACVLVSRLPRLSVPLKRTRAVQLCQWLGVEFCLNQE